MKIKAAILVIVLAANTALLHADQQDTTSGSTTESVPERSSTNWTTSVSPGVSALATPTSFLQYGPPPACVNCAGNKSGSCLHRLLAWASYCPKERIGCCKGCNSCQYKGVVPINQFYGRSCVCGSGLHATFANPTCCNGCQSCAAGAPCAAK